MRLLRKLIDFADRRGWRWLLAGAVNAVAILRGSDLKIGHDGEFWLYSSDGTTLPRGRHFDFYSNDLRELPERIKHYLEEADDCWFHTYRPNPGDVIVDVGAEVGTDAVVFSRTVGPSGKVVAIEAQPQTYELLVSTCRNNMLDNVTPLWTAVADTKGQVRISADAGVQCNFIGTQGELVPSDTLDNILADVERIALLKMNIEGAERLAILGMEATVEKTSHIVIACHDFVADMTHNDWFRTLAEVSDYLVGKGFEVLRREEDGREYVRYHLHARQRRGAPSENSRAITLT